jgi:hypothetical protein
MQTGMITNPGRADSAGITADTFMLVVQRRNQLHRANKVMRYTYYVFAVGLLITPCGRVRYKPHLYPVGHADTAYS